MTKGKDNERGRDAEPAGEVRGAAEAPRRRPRQRWISEAIVAAIPAAGETVAAAPPEAPRRPRTRVFSEAVVMAIPAGGGEAEEDAGGEAGAGA